jgi:hypothetical protein
MKLRYIPVLLLVLLVALPAHAQVPDREAALEMLLERQEKLFPSSIETLMRARSRVDAAKSAVTQSRVGVRTHYEADEDDGWEQARQHRFDYAGGRIATDTGYSWSAGAWTPEIRTIYTFDGGRLVSVRIDVWESNGGSWVPDELETYSWNQGNITQVLRQVWAGEWVNSRRTRFFYEGGTLVRAEDEEWDGAAWESRFRSLVSQQGADVVIIDQSPQGATWINEERITYHDTSVGALLDVDFTMLDELHASFFLYMLKFLPNLTSEFWEDGEWQFEIRMRWTLDGDGRRQYAYFDDWEEGEWHPAFRYGYTYLASGNVDRAVMQFPDEDDDYRPAARDEDGWFTFLVEEFAYDAQNRLVEDTFFIEFLGMRFNLSRTTYEWVELEVAVDPGASAVTIRLDAPYPNPAVLNATLTYHLGDGTHVNLRVYDTAGRLVAVLVDEVQLPGRHEVSLDAAGFASGLYLVRLDAGGQGQARLVSVVR